VNQFNSIPFTGKRKGRRKDQFFIIDFYHSQKENKTGEKGFG